MIVVAVECVVYVIRCADDWIGSWLLRCIRFGEIVAAFDVDEFILFVRLRLEKK